MNATKPPLDTIHLWDGGAYENLGLEPLYKSAQGLVGCDFLICSDASGPLSTASAYRLRALFDGRLASPRLFDIASDQIRALRSRMFVGSIARGDIQVALLRMGNSTRNLDVKSGRARLISGYDDFLSDADVAAATSYPTDLNALPVEAFDRIARHGYEVADYTLTTYSPQIFPSSGQVRSAGST